MVWLAAAFAGAAAGQAAPDDASCGPGEGADAVVRAVGDDLGLTLADGRLVRLVGIDPVDADGERPGFPNDARAKLAAWLEGRPIRLRLLAEAPDRWNRWPALASAPGGGPDATPLAIAVAVVDAGLARARPEAAAHSCWAALRAAEDGARVAKLGLWADPYYAMRQRDDAGLVALAGSFVVVEGRVAHQGETRTSVFFDLGPRHRALAVRMTKRMLSSLDQGAAGQGAWVGRRIRLRGVVDDRDGAVIDVLDGDQIEVLGGDDGTAVRP